MLQYSNKYSSNNAGCEEQLGVIQVAIISPVNGQLSLHSTQCIANVVKSGLGRCADQARISKYCSRKTRLEKGMASTNGHSWHKQKEKASYLKFEEFNTESCREAKVK